MRTYLVIQILVVIAEVVIGPPWPIVAVTAIVIGIFGTLAAHELIHRGDPLGTLAFGVVSYAHFKVSHLQGHHARVGFHDDWSTARRGETSYAFVVRAIARGWWGAWRLAGRRPGVNFMVWWCLAEITMLALAPHPGVFIALSLGAACGTELINYLGHYGLTRAPGEKITDRHSWESTDGFFLNAGRHCDHHTRPGRSHDRLELKEPTRRVPVRVAYLLLLALVPPIFFRVMHRYLD